MNLLVFPNYLNGGGLALAQKKVYDEAGCTCFPFTRTSLFDVHQHYDCAVLDWFDEYSQHASLKRTIKFAKDLLIIAILLLRRVKIIYVIDRKKPLRGGLSWQFLALRRLLAFVASGIVSCCDEGVDILREQVGERRFSTIRERIFTIVVPPLYIDKTLYTSQGKNFRGDFGIDQDAFAFVSIGSIIPSKNYDSILDVAERFLREGKNAQFLILGQTTEAEYLRHLESRCSKLANVTISTRFIDQNELIDFTRSFDAALIAHDTDSFLASASLSANCEIGINVVTSRFGVIDMLPDDLVYSFDARSDSALPDRIYTSAAKAYDDWLRDPVGYYRRADELSRYVSDNWSVSALGKRWKDVFARLS